VLAHPRAFGIGEATAWCAELGDRVGRELRDHPVEYCPFTILRRPWSDDLPAPVLLLRQTADGVHITEPRDRSLPCSGEQDYRYANLEFLVVRRDTRQALRGSGLLVHLIRDHRFFEGEHSPFRLDPERAAQVLGLV
jgi:hypothetical protein